MVCRNEKGVLGTVSNLLAAEDVNIDSGKFQSDVEGNSELLLQIEVKDSSHLYRTIEKLSRLKAVLEVVRLTSG